MAASSLSNEPLLMSVVTRPVKNFFKLSKYKKNESVVTTTVKKFFVLFNFQNTKKMSQLSPDRLRKSLLLNFQKK